MIIYHFYDELLKTNRVYMLADNNDNSVIYPSSLAATRAAKIFGVLRWIIFISSGGCGCRFIIWTAHNSENSKLYRKIVFEINQKLFNKRQ